MAGSVEADFKQAATAQSINNPNDPIANSFAQYKALAQLRVSVTGIAPPKSPTSTQPVPSPNTPKGSVELVNTPTKTPQQILIKWVDRRNILRTRNRLFDGGPETHFPGSHLSQFRREAKRAFDIIVNKDDIKEYILLNPITAEALRHYSAGNFEQFLSDVLTNKIVTSDMLDRIGRGPIFEPWMLKKLIFDTVMKSSVDFNKSVADNAVAATAHFIANNGMVIGRAAEIGYEEWKAESEDSLRNYFAEVDASTTTSSIFTLFEQIILQFGTPANIGTSSVEDLIARAALTYAIILQAASRAVEQLVRDSTEHAAKVSLDVSIIFAAITLGAGVAPVPYLSLVVDDVEGVINTVIDNHVQAPVDAVNAVANTLNDQFSNCVLKPALAGDRVPGLLQQTGPEQPAKAVSSTDGKSGVVAKDAGATAPVLTPAAKRRQLGQLFNSKYQDYIGMLDTVHTPMRKMP